MTAATPNNKPSGHSLSLTNRKKGGFNDRSTSTVKRLLMYKNSKPFYDKDGKIEKEAPFQAKTKSGQTVRVEPNIRWFSNTRVVTQDALDKFRGEIAHAVVDPYRFVMKPSKAPLSLLSCGSKHARSHLLEVESYKEAFSGGTKQINKNHKHKHDDLESLVESCQSKVENYVSKCDVEQSENSLHFNVGAQDQNQEEVAHSSLWRHGKMRAGSTQKFWNEVYKVIDSSHVIIEVIDARDPIGTRCHAIERYLAKEKPLKNLILVLNKCDLIPSAVLKKWLFILSRDHPVVAFRATKKKQFGKENLMNILRQFVKLHKIKENHHLCVGLLGYPNVGKSSIINTLKDGDVCKVAPLPGQTRCWQYVTLTRHIYLIDCPGVVRSDKMSEEDVVLRGVVKVENLENPERYISKIIKLANPHHLCKVYKLLKFKDETDFLEQVAQKRGRLLQGGISDLKIVSSCVIRDWQFGKIPHYVSPPKDLLNEAKIRAAATIASKMKSNPDDRNAERNTAAVENDSSTETKNSSDIQNPCINSVNVEESIPELDIPKDGVDEWLNQLSNSSEFDSDIEKIDEKLDPVQFDIDLGDLDIDESIFKVGDVEKNEELSVPTIDSDKSNSHDLVLKNKDKQKIKKNSNSTDVKLKFKFMEFLKTQNDPAEFWEFANNEIRESRAERKKKNKRSLSKKFNTT